MLVNKTKQGNTASGFTIIEVMIVLGIAGLIMLIVLIAIPQLQRNQRNTARKDVLGRISTEINNYVGNNGGKVPVATFTDVTGNIGVDPAADSNSFAGKYLKNANVNDPRTGTPFTFDDAAPVVGTSTPGTIQYVTGAVCDGEASTTTGATPRNFAILVALEGGAQFCLDNK